MFSCCSQQWHHTLFSFQFCSTTLPLSSLGDMHTTQTSDSRANSHLLKRVSVVMNGMRLMKNKCRKGIRRGNVASDDCVSQLASLPTPTADHARCPPDVVVLSYMTTCLLQLVVSSRAAKTSLPVCVVINCGQASSTGQQDLESSRAVSRLVLNRLNCYCKEKF